MKKLAAVVALTALLGAIGSSAVVSSADAGGRAQGRASVPVSFGRA